MIIIDLNFVYQPIMVSKFSENEWWNFIYQHVCCNRKTVQQNIKLLSFVPFFFTFIMQNNKTLNATEKNNKYGSYKHRDMKVKSYKTKTSPYRQMQWSQDFRNYSQVHIPSSNTAHQTTFPISVNHWLTHCIALDNLFQSIQPQKKICSRYSLTTKQFVCPLLS